MFFGTRCILMSVLCNDDRRRGVVLMGLFANIGLFVVYFCIAFVFIVFLKLFVRALHCIFFSLSATAFK